MAYKVKDLPKKSMTPKIAYAGWQHNPTLYHIVDQTAPDPDLDGSLGDPGKTFVTRCNRLLWGPLFPPPHRFQDDTFTDPEKWSRHVRFCPRCGTPEDFAKVYKQDVLEREKQQHARVLFNAVNRLIRDMQIIARLTLATTLWEKFIVFPDYVDIPSIHNVNIACNVATGQTGVRFEWDGYKFGFFLENEQISVASIRATPYNPNK